MLFLGSNTKFIRNFLLCRFTEDVAGEAADLMYWKFKEAPNVGVVSQTVRLWVQENSLLTKKLFSLIDTCLLWDDVLSAEL